MKHTYLINANNDIEVDGGKHIIKTNKNLTSHQQENQAFKIIDFILENERENLKLYLESNDDLKCSKCCGRPYYNYKYCPYCGRKIENIKGVK